MKNAYVTPTAEKISFQYQEQVAASGATCTNKWENEGSLLVKCQDQEFVQNYLD